MSTQDDLPKLAMALEYADLAAALYLAGGSEHAARLLAAGAEQLLGDLARLLGGHVDDDEVQSLLTRIALRYQAPLIEPRGHAQARQQQTAVQRAGELAGLPGGEARRATAAYLRACWFMLESMGLEAVIPLRLQRAVDHSTICASAAAQA
ncbi:hypothetical protein [Roseateles violae]|uniref:Uncharacterized protein n=1 Tax=Roseateles violae TaxID=3058042 RepID=A0ABT8DWN8_9BURK|nr:hypothetical protein [Pelomonas sp. PFR6]MDN3922566.1 hypothetical protein [Pelomonas sp. PFR6]